MTRSIGLVFVSSLFFSASTADARTLTARWDANTDGITAGYTLYWDTAPDGGGDGVFAFNADVGNVTAHQVDVLPGSAYYFVVRAYDSSHFEGPPSNQVSITVTNTPPTLENPGTQTSTAGSSPRLQLIASDPDGDPVTYLVTGLPPSLSVDPSSGLISGTLDAGSAGNYSVTATASDGNQQTNVQMGGGVSVQASRSTDPNSGPRAGSAESAALAIALAG